MPTVFRRNLEEGTWTAEIPCPWQGQCELEVADSQTSETLGRFDGFSDGGVARFEIPVVMQNGAAVRLSVCKGDKSMTGLCRLPVEQTGSELQFKIAEAELPLRKIQEVLPGVLVGSIRSKIGSDGLVVGESSPMFAAVSRVTDGLVSCNLVEVLDDGTFRFEVQLAGGRNQEVGQ